MTAPRLGSGNQGKTTRDQFGIVDLDSWISLPLH